MENKRNIRICRNCGEEIAFWKRTSKANESFWYHFNEDGTSGEAICFKLVKYADPVPMTISSKILISEQVAPNLVTRGAADKLFKNVNKLTQKRVTIDFKHVVFMSRSFAHEYYIRKNLSNKEIIETNISKEVLKMFEVVSKYPQPKVYGFQCLVDNIKKM